MVAPKYVAFAIFAITLPAFAIATEYIVGDGDGWDVGPNYSLWATGKVFHIGDKLVFQYERPHNVYKVDGNGFKDCKASGNVLNSGNDTITLTQPGKKWYICGYSDHCLRGQKLLINVMSNGPIPSPTPRPATSHSYALSISSCHKIILLPLLIMGIFAISSN